MLKEYYLLKKNTEKKKMLLKGFLLFCICLLSLCKRETQSGNVDMLAAVKEFCRGKSSKNFCSNEQLKVSYEIIRKQQEKQAEENQRKINIEKLIEEERQKQMKLEKLNKYLMVNGGSRYLKDFFTGRYF